jgi:hypothetical protein
MESTLPAMSVLRSNLPWQPTGVEPELRLAIRYVSQWVPIVGEPHAQIACQNSAELFVRPKAVHIELVQICKQICFQDSVSKESLMP